MFKTSAFGIQKVILTMSMAFLLVIVGLFITQIRPAQATTVEEFQAQIDALNAQINALNQTTSSNIAPQSDSCQYVNAITKTLYQGMTDAQVLSLQKFLNRSGAPVAVTGSGSLGNETNYFGAGTRFAVQKWQTINGVVSSGTPMTTEYGVVGSFTRLKMREVCSASTVSDQLGTYVGYLGGSLTPFITTQNITKADALANCKINQTNNPTLSIRCTWNGVEIFTFTPAAVNPSVEIISPSANSAFKIGDVIPVKYSYANIPPKSQVEVTITAISTLTSGVAGGTWQSKEIITTSGSDTYNKQTGPGYLDAPGTYEISAVVKTCNPSGCNYAPPGKAISPYTKDVIVTIAAPAPAPAPTLTLLSPVTNVTYANTDSMTVKWSAKNLPSDGYFIVLLKNGTNEYPIVTKTLSEVSATFPIQYQTNIVPGTYNVMVKLVNNSNTSQSTSVIGNSTVTIKPAPAPAPAPTLTLLSPVTNVTYANTDSMTVKWSAKNLPSDGYFIVLLKNGTNEYPIVTKTLSEVSATFPIQYQTNIVPGTYNVMVKLVNNSNTSQSTSVIGNSTVTIKPAVSPTTLPLTSGSLIQNTNLTFTEDLYRGTGGAQVTLLQQALAREGLFNKEITGNFYDVTLEAVRAFQIRYGIKATGYVGAATRSVLNTK